MPIYLRALEAIQDAESMVSSHRLAELAKTSHDTLRRDLWSLELGGQRGVGYDVDYLIERIRRELGLQETRNIAIIGIGNLGHALANYWQRSIEGFRIVALFDVSQSVVGTNVGNLTVTDFSKFGDFFAVRPLHVAVLTTPASAAQRVAEQAMAAGAQSIINFAPISLNLPTSFPVRHVDLTTEAHILGFYLNHPDKSPLAR